MRRGQARSEVATSTALSVLFHALVVGALFVVRAPAPDYTPRTFNITMVAAAPGPRTMGAATETPPPAKVQKKPEPALAPKVNEVKTAPRNTKKAPEIQSRVPRSSVASAKAAGSTAQSSSKAPAPDQARGGPTGGNGSDVVSAVFNGLDFPAPEYLRNMINRVMSKFQSQPGWNYVADFDFAIDRGGCVTAVTRAKSSGNRIFDAQAKAAIELASKGCGFGPLPDVWTKDALAVRFTFNPVIMR